MKKKYNCKFCHDTGVIDCPLGNDFDTPCSCKGNPMTATKPMEGDLTSLQKISWPISHDRGDFLAVGMSLSNAQALVSAIEEDNQPSAEYYKLFIENETLREENAALRARVRELEAAQEVTETEFGTQCAWAMGNLPLTKAMPQTWRTIAQFIEKTWPTGIKIVKEKAIKSGDVFGGVE